jgi:hypothetical protein
MTTEYEIVPGESIGPFRLGMTRREIGQARDRARRHGVRFPIEEIPRQGVSGGFPTPGVTVTYDAEDRCCKLQALFGYKPKPPVFTLFGHVVNGMTDKTLASILRSAGFDVKFSYASVVSRSAGLEAIKWEASDEHIMCINVTPKK